MAKPVTRNQFKKYCLTKLGAPVIQINVSDDQIEDRIDEAMSFFGDYHYNGADTIYIKHAITATDIVNGYIPIPEDVIGVSRIFDIGSSVSMGSGMFNLQYQFVLNNLEDLTGYSIQNYYMTMQSMRFLEENLVGWPMIRFNNHSRKLYLETDMKQLAIGTYIVVEASSILDSQGSASVWSDRWLQNYATILIKEQWGSNLSKFPNMQLVGGIQFNGSQIYDDAKTERKVIEDECIRSLQGIVSHFSG